MVTFQELIMISREFNEFTCLVTQHDHAQVSLDIFNMMNENLKSKSNNIPDLQYAIRNHDCGWIEYDLYPKLSDNNLIYTFQNMENHLQLELWLKSVSSSINPYSSLLISEHFKFLAKQSKTLDITLKKDFIKKSDQLIKPQFSAIVGLVHFYAQEQNKEFTFNQSKGIIGQIVEWIKSEL